MAQATETKLKFSLQIYDENTIEVGVYIDRHLYKVMEEAIKSQDATEVKDALLKMVHELMTAVGIKSSPRILLFGFPIYVALSDPDYMKFQQWFGLFLVDWRTTMHGNGFLMVFQE